MDGAGELLLTLVCSFVISVLLMSVTTGVALVLSASIKVVLGATLLVGVVAFVAAFLLIAKFAW